MTARKSLASKDHIISMIDGKPYKTLRRHLSGHGLTPEQYRERYNLKPDYPMCRKPTRRHAATWPRRSVSVASRVRRSSEKAHQSCEVSARRGGARPRPAIAVRRGEKSLSDMATSCNLIAMKDRDLAQALEYAVAALFVGGSLAYGIVSAIWG